MKRGLKVFSQTSVALDEKVKKMAEVTTVTPMKRGLKDVRHGQRIPIVYV